MKSEASRSEWIGRTVDGRFSLLQWLGGSERGSVFLTEKQGPGKKRAAIKLIPCSGAAAEARLAALAMAAKLSHPHLLRLFHTGRCQIGAAKQLYAVTEYADEILSLVLSERALTPTETSEMLGPLLDALAFLHGQGIAHGRLKPSNIMVANDLLKLSSDSLQAAGEAGKHDPASEVYDAPERSAGTISPAGDMWSLGVTLVEAMTQHPPLWDKSTQKDPVVPDSIPEPFAGIARKCLRVDPKRRWTASEIKDRFQAGSSFSSLADRFWKDIPTRLRVAAMVGAMLVAVSVAAAVHPWSHSSETSLPSAKQAPEAASAAVHSKPSAAVYTQAPAAVPMQTPQAGTTQAKAVAASQEPATVSSQTSAPMQQTLSDSVVKGAVVEQVLPDIPDAARRTIQGKASLSIRVSVDANGQVADASLDSPGASRDFANFSLQAARRWRFKPAQTGGRAVSSVWVLHFELRQADTKVSPVEVTP